MTLSGRPAAPQPDRSRARAGAGEQSPIDSVDALGAYEAEIARNYRWNLVAHLAYGLLGTTGWRLITAPTFIPDYAYRLGGSNLIVGALLFAGGLARVASPLAGAAWVAHRPLVKRTAVVIGSGMRFQVLGMALAALLFPPWANLPAFFLFYVVFNVLNGLQGVVFGVLMAKVIPLARRGRFVGVRDFLGGATAALVAWLAGGFLRAMPFPASYGLTYLVAFAFTSLGLLCFAAIREPRSPFIEEPRSLASVVASIPGLLRTDRIFAWYCVARGFGSIGLMATPFFIIAAGHALPGGPVAVAPLSVAYFIASTLTNLAWGQIADRKGFRTVFLLAGVVWLAALAFAFSGVATIGAAVLLFVLVGAGQGGIQMASINMVYEFGDHTGLGVRIAIVNALGELMTAVAPLAGGAIADGISYQALYVTAAAFTVLASSTMALRVTPRRRT